MEQNIMIKVENVSKEYRIGMIGGTTLRDELQRFHAKRRKTEDPTLKIGQEILNDNEKFFALNNISFEINKGEAIGIIGHNGAGKSTLLKLITRITAPTSGWIGLNGRVASMLEVGTGFHPELTGRENIYLNGAILGMRRREIDAKIEQIIDFSEVRKFIDTPVKRYSSGMYVKLAFAVAAHLDSEIVIMDEVLAVGDMAFQRKCLTKMRDAVNTEGRTVLYVSHNMNTIRQLCQRCLVLENGKLIYDGDVETAIAIYSHKKPECHEKYIFDKSYHSDERSTEQFVIHSLDILNNKPDGYSKGDNINLNLTVQSKQKIEGVYFRFELKNYSESIIGTSITEKGMDFKNEEKEVFLRFDTTHLMPGKYTANIVAYLRNEFGNDQYIDGVYPGFHIEISENLETEDDMLWLPQYWGNIRLHDVKVKESRNE